MTNTVHDTPTKRVSVRDTFGIDSDLIVPAFEERDDHVPDIDPAYRFNPDVTLAILAGFAHNRRVALQGLHGTGKSTHIEQVAARLNWPCVRVNLDGHISRLDLVGKDAIVVRDGHQVTEFQEGILPWALQRPAALVFDEYDAGRPEVMFVIQRVLERDGGFTLLDQKRVIRPHPYFRLFATMNTLGQGNATGLYHGAQLLNHAQLDRWNLVASLDYLPAQEEAAIVQNQFCTFKPNRAKASGKNTEAIVPMRFVRACFLVLSGVGCSTYVNDLGQRDRRPALDGVRRGDRLVRGQQSLR